MFRASSLLIAGIAIALLSSFRVSEKDLTGRWNWLFVTNAANDTRTDIKELTMGMVSGISIELRDDGTCIETKTRVSDNKSSSLSGKWKLEAEGTALSMNMKGEWRPARIVRLANDTLELEMTPGAQLSMVRAK